MIATLGGLTFVGDAGPATYTIEEGGLVGWFGGVEMRHESIPRPLGNGDFPAPGYLGSRIITLSGLILADNATDFENAIAALEEVLDDGSEGEFAVEQATGTFTVQVRMHGAPDIDPQVYGSVARYQLQLWAADPTKTPA